MNEQAALLRKQDQDAFDEAMKKALAPERALLLTGRGTLAKGDVPGHEFHGNQFSEGQTVRFDGKSADDKVNGFMDVKVINTHSNKDKVDRVEGKGRRARIYDKEGRQHLPTATVENSRGKQFEAYHHTLSAVAKKSHNPLLDALGK